MPKAFSPATLQKFEDASASIPLRQLVRVFEGAGVRLGTDPGGAGGTRRTQFRRYVAGIDQGDPQRLARLGAALGAMIDEVATSKQDFLVKAAESDGFGFANGVFRPARKSDDRNSAIRDAEVQLESACRTILQLIAAPLPVKNAGLVAVVNSTLEALEQQQLRSQR